MRVLMVSDDYLPNPGGIAAHVYELSKALVALGHEVDLVAGHDRKHQGELPAAPAGMRVLRHRGFTWSRPGYMAMALHTARALRDARARSAYDVCHWHSLVYETWGVALGARGLPRVFTNHSSGYLRRAQSPLRRATQLRAILSVAHEVITPSRELLERTVDAGYPRARVRYIPNGVDVETFAPGAVDGELQRTYGLTPDDSVIVAPRRLDPKNGIDVLVRAMPAIVAALPNVKALLVGGGQEHERLQALAAELGVAKNVVFCGSQPRSEMVRHLRLGHIAALPSRAEAVSLAGLEAMAVGLPVVGSRVGGIPEFVAEGENGALFPIEDSGALAQAAIELLRDRARLAQMGATARRSVQQRFSWRSAAEQALEVYAAARSTARA